MLGERHFIARDRLQQVISGIETLAKTTGCDVSHLLPSKTSGGLLGKPVVLAVCGEVNAGKSSLLNALCGSEACPVGTLPKTRRTERIVHPTHLTDLGTWSGGFQPDRRAVPEEFFRFIELIDTPGINQLSDDEPSRLAEYLEAEADFIFAVFPVTNPWSPPSWRFLELLDDAALDRCQLVLQQTDTRAASDIPIILGHMRDLSEKRLGRALPIHPLSCAPDAEDLGISRLRAQLTHSIENDRDRRRALDDWRRSASMALRAIEDRIDAKARGLTSDVRFLDQIELEIDAMFEQSVRRLPDHLVEVASHFEQDAKVVVRLLWHRLGVARSVWRLFWGDRTGHLMEEAFVNRLNGAIREIADRDAGQVITACNLHRRETIERVQERVGIDIGENENYPVAMASSHLTFVQSLSDAAKRGISELKVRPQLERDLRLRNQALKAYSFCAFACWIAAGVLGTMEFPVLPWIFLGFGALFLVGGLLAGWVTRKRLRKDFQDRLLATCEGFALVLGDDYEEALRRIFRDYKESLDQLREHLVREKQALAPQQKRWQEWFLRLKAIEQEYDDF